MARYAFTGSGTQSSTRIPPGWTSGSIQASVTWTTWDSSQTNGLSETEIRSGLINSMSALHSTTTQSYSLGAMYNKRAYVFWDESLALVGQVYSVTAIRELFGGQTAAETATDEPYVMYGTNPNYYHTLGQMRPFTAGATASTANTYGSYPTNQYSKMYAIDGLYHPYHDISVKSTAYDLGAQTAAFSSSQYTACATACTTYLKGARVYQNLGSNPQQTLATVQFCSDMYTIYWDTTPVQLDALAYNEGPLNGSTGQASVSWPLSNDSSLNRSYYKIVCWGSGSYKSDGGNYVYPNNWDGPYGPYEINANSAGVGSPYEGGGIVGPSTSDHWTEVLAGSHYYIVRVCVVRVTDNHIISYMDYKRSGAT